MQEDNRILRILSLDGGGAKGMYSLGVLKEVEALAGKPLWQVFDLIYGTSTGAIIGSLLALGMSVDEVLTEYRTHVPKIMRAKSARAKSSALAAAGKEIINNRDFLDMKTNIGIVATRWQTEKPMIFKTSVSQAHGRKATFVPGFGVPLLEAIQASCSAYPFFERKFVTVTGGDQIELFDGGFSANNPALFAITDAVFSLGYQPSNCRLLSVGCGRYPEPSPSFLIRTVRLLPLFTMLSQLLQKTMETNTNTMEHLRSFAFKNVPTVRINDTYERPEMATDLFEHDLNKLALLRQLGQESFAKHEDDIAKLIFHEEQ